MRAEEGDKPDKRRYKTTNWREHNKALKARGALTVWLDKDMQWFAPPTGKRGRHPTFSDAELPVDPVQRAWCFGIADGGANHLATTHTLQSQAFHQPFHRAAGNAELHIRVALLNRFTQLGRPVTVPVA